MIFSLLKRNKIRVALVADVSRDYEPIALSDER